MSVGLVAIMHVSEKVNMYCGVRGRRSTPKKTTTVIRYALNVLRDTNPRVITENIYRISSCSRLGVRLVLRAREGVLDTARKAAAVMVEG